MAGNGSTIDTQPYCVEGFVNVVPPYIKATAAISCILSVLGVLVILYTHIAFRRYRSKAREIIIHVSLMDLTVALANFIGIVVDFESMLYPYFDGGTYDALHPVHDLSTKFRAINNLCITQAAFAVYGTICSVLWTTSLVVYFYFTILGDNAKITKIIFYSFYVICYGLPALVVVWLGTTGKIGYSPVGGGGWCSLVFESAKDRYTLFLGYDLWMYITIVVIITATVAIMFHFKTQIPIDSMSQQNRKTVLTIEKKLLAIPIIFILMRIWSFLLELITLYAELKSCALVMFFLGMGAIGDSGQGFSNAIVFCLFNKQIRLSYKKTLMKCLRRRKHNPMETPNNTTVVGTDTRAEVGSLILSQTYTTKQWHVQSES